MSTEKKQNGTTDIAALESEAFAEALEGAKSPGERLALIYAKQARDEARATAAIWSDMARRTQNADAPALERARQANEAHAALAAGRREWHCHATTPLLMDQVRGSPTVQVVVKLGGTLYGADEGERAGQHGISTCVVSDSAEAERLLMASCWEPHLAEREDLQRRGEVESLRVLTKHVEGRSRVESFQFRRWREIHQLLLKRLVRQGGTLEALGGIVTLIDPGIVVSDEPLKTEIRP